MKITAENLQVIYDTLKPIARAVPLNGDYSAEEKEKYQTAGIDPFLENEDFVVYRTSGHDESVNFEINGIFIGDYDSLAEIYSQAMKHDAADGKFDGVISPSEETPLEISLSVFGIDPDFQTIFESIQNSVMPIVVTSQGGSRWEGTAWIAEVENLPGDSSRYYAITNHHVIDENYENETGYFVQVPSEDGTGSEEIPADLVGSDDVFDVGVICFVAKDSRFTSLLLADPNQRPQKGDLLLIPGNRKGFGIDFLTGTTNQEFETNLSKYVFGFESDVETIGGTSGAPVINIDGKVIGLNNSSVKGQDYKSAHHIFISEVRRSYEDIRVKGYSDHGDIDLIYQKVDRDQLKSIDSELDYPNGAWMVNNYYPFTSDSTRQTLKPGDIILTIDGKKAPDWENSDFLATVACQKHPGDIAVLEIWREGKIQDVQLQLASYSRSRTTSWLAPDESVIFETDPSEPASQFYFYQEMNPSVLVSFVNGSEDGENTYTEPQTLISINGKNFNSLKQVQKYLLSSPDVVSFSYIVKDYEGTVSLYEFRNPLFVGNE